MSSPTLSAKLTNQFRHFNSVPQGGQKASKTESKILKKHLESRFSFQNFCGQFNQFYLLIKTWVQIFVRTPFFLTLIWLLFKRTVCIPCILLTVVNLDVWVIQYPKDLTPTSKSQILMCTKLKTLQCSKMSCCKSLRRHANLQLHLSISS